jgi:hypothetical protein
VIDIPSETARGDAQCEPKRRGPRAREGRHVQVDVRREWHGVAVVATEIDQQWVQDVVGELDNTCMEHLARFGQRIRGIFLANNGILRERLQEDGVDERSCRNGRRVRFRAGLSMHDARLVK